jgi:hypothetical protein
MSWVSFIGINGVGLPASGRHAGGPESAVPVTVFADNDQPRIRIGGRAGQGRAAATFWVAARF